MAEDNQGDSSGCSVGPVSDLHEQQHTQEGSFWAQQHEELPASLEAAADRVQMAVDFVDSLMRHPRGLVPDADPPLTTRQGQQQRYSRGSALRERGPSEPAGLDLNGVPLEAASLFCLSTDVSLEAMMEQQPPQHQLHHHHHQQPLQQQPQQQQQQQQPEAPMDSQGYPVLPERYHSKAPSPPKQRSTPTSARRSICSIKEALNRLQSRSLAQRGVADKAPGRGINSKGSSSVGAGGATEASSDGLQEERMPAVGAPRTISPAAGGPDHGGGGAGSSPRAAAPPVLEPGPPRTPLDARQQRRRSRSAALGRLKARRSLDVSCASTPGRPWLSSPSSSRLPDTPTAREGSVAVAPEATAATARPATEGMERLEALRMEEAGTKGPVYASERSSGSSSFSREGFLGAAPLPRHAEEPLIPTPARTIPADRSSQGRPSSGSASRGPRVRSHGRQELPGKPLVVGSHLQLEPPGRSPGGDGSQRNQRSSGGGGDARALSARLEGLATEWQQREGERRRRQQDEEEMRRQQQQQQRDEEEARRQQHRRLQEEEARRRRQHQQQVEEEQERRRQQRKQEERRQKLLQQQQREQEQDRRQQQQEAEERRRQQAMRAGRERAAAQEEGDWAVERPKGRRGHLREDAPSEAAARRLHEEPREGLQTAPPDLRPSTSEARKQHHQHHQQQQRTPPSPGSGLLSEVQQRVELLETLVQRAQEQEASEEAPAAVPGGGRGASGGAGDLVGTPPASAGCPALRRATLSPEASGSAEKLISRLRGLESVVLEHLGGTGAPVAERLEGRMDAVFAAGMAAARSRRRARASGTSGSMVFPEEDAEPQEQPPQPGRYSRGGGGGGGVAMRPEPPFGCPHDAPNPPPQGLASEAPLSFTTPSVQPLPTSRLEHHEQEQQRRQQQPSEVDEVEGAAGGLPSALPPNPGAAPTPLYEPYQEPPGPSSRRAEGGGTSVMSDDARRGAAVGPLQGSGPSSRSRSIQEDEEEDLDGEWLVRMLQSATPQPSREGKDDKNRGRKAQAAGLRSRGPGAQLGQQGRQEQQGSRRPPGRPQDPSLWASLQDMEATVRSCSLRLGVSSIGASSAALSRRGEIRPQGGAGGSSSPAGPAPGAGTASRGLVAAPSQQRLDQQGGSNNGSSSDDSEDWVEAERRRFQLIMQYSWKLGFASPTPAAAAAGQRRVGARREHLASDEAPPAPSSAAAAAERPGSRASSSLYRQSLDRVPRQGNGRQREEGAAAASSCPTGGSGSPRAAGELREGGTEAPLRQQRPDVGGGREAPISPDAASEFSRLVDEAEKLGSNLRVVQSYLDGLHEAPLVQQQQQLRPPLPHGAEHLISSSSRRAPQEQQQGSQAQGPQTRLPAALPQPYLQGTAAQQSQRSWRRDPEAAPVASASWRSSSAGASAEHDQEGQDGFQTVGGSPRSRTPRTETADHAEHHQASSGSRLRRQLRAALERHTELLVRSGRAAAGLRETLGRHQEVISQLLGEASPQQQQQQRRNGADLAESVPLSGWRDTERRVGDLLADARALRSEVDARAASEASLEVGMSGRGGGVRAWSGVLAECIAAERQAAALQSLCLREGRAATSQAERCSTAASDAEAAAREIAQLQHHASLAELELVPGRIAAMDDGTGSLTSRVASRVRRVGISAAALGHDLEDAVREAAALGDALAELLESLDRAAAEAAAIRARLAGLNEQRRSMEAAAGARHAGPASDATARRPGRRENTFNESSRRDHSIDPGGSMRGYSPQALSPPPVAPARSLAMTADSPFPPAASGFSTPSRRDHPQDVSWDHSSRDRQEGRESGPALRRPIDGNGASQSSGAAGAPNGAISSSLAAALRRVRGDRPLPAASTRRLSSAISRLEHGRALARRQRGRDGVGELSRASAMSSRNGSSDSDS